MVTHGSVENVQFAISFKPSLLTCLQLSCDSSSIVHGAFLGQKVVI